MKTTRAADIADDVAFHVGRLNSGHNINAVLVSVLQVLSSYAYRKPLNQTEMEATVKAAMDKLNVELTYDTMGTPLITPRKEKA